jgi:rubrerythrin
MGTFDAREVFKFAIKIEENGYKFYSYLAENLEHSEAKQLFDYLAKEEQNHKKTFEGMVETLQGKELAESLPTDYFDFLRAHIDMSIFKQELSEEEMKELSDVPSALQYSIDRESDSILYYHEIKAFFPESEYAILDQIIQEERKHYIKLSQLAQEIR